MLFVAADSAWAGAQAQMLELAVGLDRAEWEPLLITCGTGGLVQRARDAGIPTRVMPFGLLRRGFPFLDYYLAGPLVLHRFLRRERIALVHTHDPASPIAIAPVAGRLGIPVVVHIHDLDQRWITRRSLAAISRARSVVVAISDAAARWAVARGADPARVRRIYNGVHLRALASDARARARRELGIAPHECGVVLVGRLVARKGQRDAIRAFAEPALASSAARLYLIGGAAPSEPGHDDGLRALVAELGLRERVTFVGERDDAPALVAGMDLAVVPSLREAFGRVVIEALHAGVPVVAYDDGALPELVRDGIDGRVVPTGDIPALASAIAALVEDASLRARLAAGARVRAQAFSHQRFVVECSALYRELLRSPPVP